MALAGRKHEAVLFTALSIGRKCARSFRFTSAPIGHHCYSAADHDIGRMHFRQITGSVAIESITLQTFARRLAIGFLVSVAVLAVIWASLALWYRLPFPGPIRGLASGVFALSCLASIMVSALRRSARLALLVTVVLAAVLIWWSTIVPPRDADWSPDVSRQVTGHLVGDRLTLIDVRNFAWRTNEDFSEQWETREYDLAKLSSVDLFMSYWSGPLMAHMILSFGFEDGSHIAWSVEVRRRRGGAFSPIADLFKSNPLIIVAADERDVVGVRSNVRREDVQLYRMTLPRSSARQLLLAYVDDANKVANEPRWYNSITTNCTTAVVSMMRAVGDAVPFDWRLYVNGYVPDYAYMRGALHTDNPMSEIRKAAHIDERAQKSGLTPDFSSAIRQGIPSPVVRLTD